MTPHTPDMVLSQRPDGRWVARCLGCREHSGPRFYKPAAVDWQKAHVVAARTLIRRGKETP